MPQSVFVLSVIFMACILPLMLIGHYVTRWKSIKGLSAEEQRLLEALWEDSERMQNRISALETILEDQVPDWRGKA